MLDREIRTHDRGEYRGEAFVFSTRTPKARKPYSCDACGQAIPRGMRYVCFVTVGVEGPGWETWHVHGECYIAGGSMFYSDRPQWRWDEDFEEARP